MSKRDFLELRDLALAEAREVLALARKLKQLPKGATTQLLAGRAVAIILEKASTRTRVSFEVGCAQLGAHPVVLSVQSSQLGRCFESVAEYGSALVALHSLRHSRHYRGRIGAGPGNRTGNAVEQQISCLGDG